ncbi:MAG: hypothetical protein R2685_04025 [Candidatus Nitrosocosmicus sp.]|nr:hypothetical protein [Candidatus Nitrosocosmicus sp.]
MIDFNIPEELRPIISEFGCFNGSIIKITFTHIYNKVSFHSIFNTKNIQKSIDDFEKKVRKFVPNISDRHYNLLENTIYDNLEGLEKPIIYSNSDKNGSSKQTNCSIKYLRKYELDSILYEAIVVDKLPKFVCYKGSSFELIEKIDVSNHVIYPADNITTHNPIPYAFESEEELKKYVEFAKNETLESLFEKVLKMFKIFVNVDDHSLVIFTADTVYSYFQDMFGITHYNILVGLPGSGKSSALLVYRILGYRPFFVTSASAANYHTFLGSIQEGQGTIIEDEADNLGQTQDKKNILKTGYSSGGTIPKTDFPNGQRTQESYLTFCHKWLAMEELPDEKVNIGIFDRCFVHNFVKGEVSQNIKKVMKDTDSDLYKELIHLRKLLFVFKLVNQNRRFPKIKTNLTDREDELTYPLVSIFHNSHCFEKIRLALSRIIRERTNSKNNSLDSRITETLKQLIEDEVGHGNIIYVTNEQFYSKFKEVVHADDNSWDLTRSTFYLPDGTKLSKYSLSRILVSKFRAKLIRTNKFRGFYVDKSDINKITKQYEVINEITILENDGTRIPTSSDKKVTMVTEVTESKGVYPSFSVNPNAQNKDWIETQIESNKHSEPNTKRNDDYDKSNGILSKDKSTLDVNTYTFGNKPMDVSNKRSMVSNRDSEMEIEGINEISPTTYSKCVTSVTSVTVKLPQYPCYFCGTNYQTSIDFDMGNHFVEKHKSRLINLPIAGDLETRIDWIISETKRRLFEDSIDDQQGNENE